MVSEIFASIFMEVNVQLLTAAAVLSFFVSLSTDNHSVCHPLCVPGHAVSGGGGVLALHAVASSPSSAPGRA